MMRRMMVVESNDMLDPDVSGTGGVNDAPVVIAHGCNLAGGPVHGLAAAVFDSFSEARADWEAITSPVLSSGVFDAPVLAGRVIEWFGSASLVHCGVNGAGQNVVVANAFTQVLPGADATSAGVRSGVWSVMEQAREGTVVRVPLIGAGIGGMSVEDSVVSLFAAVQMCSSPATLMVYVRAADGAFGEAVRVARQCAATYRGSGTPEVQVYA